MKRGALLKRTEFKRNPSGVPAASGILRIHAQQLTALGKKVKSKPARPRSTVAERVHMGRVAVMGCCLCQFLGLGATPAEVHHVRLLHGWGRSGHANTIPLCPAHHRGQPGGVHDMGRAEFAAHYGISEIELLALVIEKLSEKE